MGRKENPGENFLSRAHNFHPPKSGGKSGEKSAVKALLQQIPFPNVYNNPARQNKKKEAENNHPTAKPSTTTKHRNLAQKINPTQNQEKPNS